MVNDSKTEFLNVGSKQQLERVNIPFIHVGEDQITPVMTGQNLGEVTFTKYSIQWLQPMSNIHQRPWRSCYLNILAAEEYNVLYHSRMNDTTGQ